MSMELCSMWVIFWKLTSNGANSILKKENLRVACIVGCSCFISLDNCYLSWIMPPSPSIFVSGIKIWLFFQWSKSYLYRTRMLCGLQPAAPFMHSPFGWREIGVMMKDLAEKVFCEIVCVNWTNNLSIPYRAWTSISPFVVILITLHLDLYKITR